MKEWFHRFSSRVAWMVGQPFAFVFSLAVVILWSITGPIFDFSNTWQLVINTGTTIVTFLMVFLIQNTQNRDAKAMHLKLDELIRSSKGARDSFIDLEDIADDELLMLDKDFRRLHDINASHVATKIHSRVKAEKSRREQK